MFNKDKEEKGVVEIELASIKEVILRFEESVERRFVALDALGRERIQAVNDVITAKALAQGLAIDKAEEASNKRFESVNEFRGQLNDTIAQFATREALAAGIREQRITTDAIAAELNKIGNRTSVIEARILIYVGIGSSVATSLAALFAWFGHVLK
jgi:hypothetical protein